MKRIIFLMTFMPLAFAGCDADKESDGEDSGRAALSKADNTGSCAGNGTPLCGGQSDGSCWCDDACAAIGDCCTDIQDACAGGGTSECEAGGGQCFGGTINCEAQGMTFGDGSCESGPGPHPQTTCCMPTETSECEAAGGECFGGTINCEAEGMTFGEGSCETGPGPHPQTTCCMPSAQTCSEQGDSCASGESCCEGLTCCSGIPVPEGEEYCSNFCPVSDRNKKENFTNVDAAEILRKVAALEITTWNYKTEPDSVRHMGPMAQDFKAAFELGNTDKAIFTVDADGVSLAAIQALHGEMKALQADNERLAKDLARLESELGRLKKQPRSRK
jgi:hypothetical protein